MYYAVAYIYISLIDYDFTITIELNVINRPWTDLNSVLTVNCRSMRCQYRPLVYYTLQNEDMATGRTVVNTSAIHSVNQLITIRSTKVNNTPSCFVTGSNMMSYPGSFPRGLLSQDAMFFFPWCNVFFQDAMATDQSHLEIPSYDIMPLCVLLRCVPCIFLY